MSDAFDARARPTMSASTGDSVAFRTGFVTKIADSQVADVLAMKTAAKYVPESQKIKERIDRYEQMGHKRGRRRLMAWGALKGALKGGAAGGTVGAAGGALGGKAGKGGLLGAGIGATVGAASGILKGRREANERQKAVKAVKGMSSGERSAFFSRARMER